jgi:hypothetical protein
VDQKVPGIQKYLDNWASIMKEETMEKQMDPAHWQ